MTKVWILGCPCTPSTQLSALARQRPPQGHPACFCSAFRSIPALRAVSLARRSRCRFQHSGGGAIAVKSLNSSGRPMRFSRSARHSIPPSGPMPVSAQSSSRTILRWYLCRSPRRRSAFALCGRALRSFDELRPTRPRFAPCARIREPANGRICRRSEISQGCPCRQTHGLQLRSCG
jgi:hypothetical protein